MYIKLAGRLAKVFYHRLQDSESSFERVYTKITTPGQKNRLKENRHVQCTSH